MKFDWYQATIKGNPIQVIGALAALGHEVVKNERVGKMYRYTDGFEIHHRERGVVARVACGGNGEGSVHAWATSDEAQEFASLVREKWRDEHLVTRLDSCEDFIDKEAFNRLRKVGRKVAKEHRVSFVAMTDPINPTAGRTQYMGSTSSEYRARTYEKGWEVVAKTISGLRLRGALAAGNFGEIRVPGLDRVCHPGEWIRTELQARPRQEEGRRAAAIASPEEVWTFTSWAHDFAKEALALDLERFYVRMRKISTDERALRFMCRQYANVLDRMRGDLGDWACVGLQIGQTLEEIAEEERTAHVMGYRTTQGQ